MKKYIIVSLCLAAIWGCSDDKVTTPDIVDKDTVDARFVTINGMVWVDSLGNTIDTLGDASKIGPLCDNIESDANKVMPNITINEFLVRFEVPKSQEIEISLETVLLSQEMKESLVSNSYPLLVDCKNYNKRIIHKKIYTSGYHTSLVKLDGYNVGAYLLKVKREDNTELCMPIILSDTLKTKKP